jgi:hypothetical protein
LVGSAKIRDVGYRDSWCIIGEKGAERGSVAEHWRNSIQGPTDTVTKTFDLAARRKKILAGYPGQADIRMLSAGAAATMLMPSNGKWLRRRKNDGALNRAPPDFYPKVWKILSKCHGILIGREFLPRDPTISEKTPEEFNFGMLSLLVDSKSHKLTL